MGAIVAADFRWQGDKWNCNMAASPGDSRDLSRVMDLKEALET